MRPCDYCENIHSRTVVPPKLRHAQDGLQAQDFLVVHRPPVDGRVQAARQRH